VYRLPPATRYPHGRSLIVVDGAPRGPETGPAAPSWRPQCVRPTRRVSTRARNLGLHLRASLLCSPMYRRPHFARQQVPVAALASIFPLPAKGKIALSHLRHRVFDSRGLLWQPHHTRDNATAPPALPNTPCRLALLLGAPECVSVCPPRGEVTFKYGGARFVRGSRGCGREAGQPGARPGARVDSLTPAPASRSTSGCTVRMIRTRNFASQRRVCQQRRQITVAGRSLPPRPQPPVPG
jgi:hypothetical protein